MAQFRVLRPIEKDGKFYLPEAVNNPPAKTRSASNGTVIPVDASGVIDLTAEQANEMNAGQVAAIPAAPTKKAKVKNGD